MLYRPARPLGLALILVCLWVLWVTVLHPVGPALELFWRGFVAGVTDTAPDTKDVASGPSSGLWRLWFLLPLIAGVYYGIVHYIFGAQRLMANYKTAPGVSFKSRLRTGRVAWIYAGGTFLAYLVLTLGIILIGLIVLPLAGFEVLEQIAGSNAGLDVNVPRWVSIVVSVILYFGVFLLWSVVYNTFVTFPLMRHMAQTVVLTQTDGLGDISQTERDEFAEAEGFAEALDLGAAI